MSHTKHGYSFYQSKSVSISTAQVMNMLGALYQQDTHPVQSTAHIDSTGLKLCFVLPEQNHPP